jgi:hypothetical protein
VVIEDALKTVRWKNIKPSNPSKPYTPYGVTICKAHLDKYALYVWGKRFQREPLTNIE